MTGMRDMGFGERLGGKKSKNSRDLCGHIHLSVSLNPVCKR
jgi:hypothetical protein